MSGIENPETIEDVEEILIENARLLNEARDVFIRPLADGGYRLQNRTAAGRWLRGRVHRKDYPSLTALCAAAKIALARARQVSRERVA